MKKLAILTIILIFHIFSCFLKLNTCKDLKKQQFYIVGEKWWKMNSFDHMLIFFSRFLKLNSDFKEFYLLNVGKIGSVNATWLLEIMKKIPMKTLNGDSADFFRLLKK